MNVATSPRRPASLSTFAFRGRGGWSRIRTRFGAPSRPRSRGPYRLLPPGIEIAAVAVTNQRESSIAWDRATGHPLGPCITWQCRRTAPFCDELRRAGRSETVVRRTGLAIDPLFSATKFRWLLDNIADGHARAARGEICLGNVDGWVLWNLTDGAEHATDLTNASRTQLLNLQTTEWDPELLESVRHSGGSAAPAAAIQP